MSHVTQEQAKRLFTLGFPFRKEQRIATNVYDFNGYLIGLEEKYVTTLPSAEELMEWLKDKIVLSVWYSQGKWIVDSKNPFEYQRIGHDEELTSALFQATCWVLSRKPPRTLTKAEAEALLTEKLGESVRIE